MNRPIACLERDQANGAAVVGARQPDEPLDLLRHADEGVHPLAVAHARELQRDGEAEIGDERERMRRIDGERREHREDVIEEMILEPRLLALGYIGPIHQHDAVVGQHGAQLAPPLLLVAGERADRLRDARKLFGRGETVGTPGGDARRAAGRAGRQRGP